MAGAPADHLSIRHRHPAAQGREPGRSPGKRRGSSCATTRYSHWRLSQTSRRQKVQKKYGRARLLGDDLTPVLCLSELHAQGPSRRRLHRRSSTAKVAPPPHSQSQLENTISYARGRKRPRTRPSSALLAASTFDVCASPAGARRICLPGQQPFDGRLNIGDIVPSAYAAMTLTPEEIRGKPAARPSFSERCGETEAGRLIFLLRLVEQNGFGCGGSRVIREYRLLVLKGRCLDRPRSR